MDGEYLREIIPAERNFELVFSAYYDDLEIANPVGVNTKKHKVAMFYWQLLNIPPQFRSKLHCIQLLGIAKTKDIKQFGFDAILQNFIQGLKELYDVGIEIFGHGKMFGRLLHFSGDTLAMHTIGKFKEGVGFAHRICLKCYASKDDIGNMLLQEQCTVRNPQKHNEECEILSGALSAEARKHWSKEYGVNGKSILMSIPGFEITESLLHDPMHIFFEGFTKYIITELLKTFISEKIFTIEELNASIERFKETYINVPVNINPIDHAGLKNMNLRQTASQMQYFSHLLPVIIGTKIPRDNPKWQHFLTL